MFQVEDTDGAIKAQIKKDTLPRLQTEFAARIPESVADAAFGPFEMLNYRLAAILFVSSVPEIVTAGRLDSFFEWLHAHFVSKFESKSSRLSSDAWLDCLTYNIRWTFKMLWIHASTPAKSSDMPKIKFLYPIRNANLGRKVWKSECLDENVVFDAVRRLNVHHHEDTIYLDSKSESTMQAFKKQIEDFGYSGKMSTLDSFLFNSIKTMDVDNKILVTRFCNPTQCY